MQDQITGETDERGRLTLGAEYANRHVVATVTRNIDVDSMPVVRAVHFLNATHYGRAQLYAGHGIDRAEAIFGIDWGTGPVWVKNEFADIDNASAIKDYNAMENAKSGALVAAYYGRRKENQDTDDPYNLDDAMVLGICPPDATIQAVPIEASSAPDDNGGPTFVKALPLVDTVELTRNERRELFERFAAGRSVYETDSREEMIREAYMERRY
ncbi:hypothetical protein [Halomicrobium salinisoli]|uniref:hypothetical protein n=1 Tax=Halomicrobium salinisoli TaxID=2878391 RepID=UPI001CF0D1CF|nr:hypothetical protein [Halomicrobium salinisoli]